MAVRSIDKFKETEEALHTMMNEFLNVMKADGPKPMLTMAKQQEAKKEKKEKEEKESDQLKKSPSRPRRLMGVFIPPKPSE